MLSLLSRRHMNRLGVALVLLCALAGAAHAAEVTLKNAWMRPAPAGADSARAYVDVTSDASLVLTGATTPVAGKVQIVLVQTIGDPSTEAVVPTLAVPAGGTTRLAYRGNHLRLSGITRDIANGDPVPLTLTFTDGAGKTVKATTDILVRGLLLPQQMPETSRDAAMPANPPAAK